MFWWQSCCWLSFKHFLFSLVCLKPPASDVLTILLWSLLRTRTCHTPWSSLDVYQTCLNISQGSATVVPKVQKVILMLSGADCCSRIVWLVVFNTFNFPQYLPMIGWSTNIFQLGMAKLPTRIVWPQSECFFRLQLKFWACAFCVITLRSKARASKP